MAVSNITLVTALFDIGRPNWRHYGLPEAQYLGWLKNTLSLNANIIVFVDDHFKDRIVQMIQEVGGQSRIQVILSPPATRLPAYRKFGKELETLMGSPEFQKIASFPVPEATQPLYNVIMFNKVEFLKEAIMRSRFYKPQGYYWWVDAGGLRESLDTYKGVSWPDPAKIDALPANKCVFFSHHAEIKVTDEKNHSMSQTRYIQGTAFGGQAMTLNWLSEEFDKKVRYCLKRGFIGSDEKVFDLVYLDCPELFHLEVSGWRTYFAKFL